MLFNSAEFIFVFLPAAIAAYYVLARFSLAVAMTGATIASLVFYAAWNPLFLPIPIFSILFNYFLARHIVFGEKRWAGSLTATGIIANLAVLGYFKYADFFLSIATGAPPPSSYVPLALSFTTFIQIAFLVYVYRRRPCMDLSAYAMFVSFFPHLIAGPIVRWNELGPQIADPNRYRPDWTNVALGLTIFTFGLGKKLLIADPLAVHVAPVFDAAARAEPVTALAAWSAGLAYSAQLYFDFSGYSDMAVGLGLLFNLRLPINFAAPFRATSMIDLWRRWHVSLSRFLRDFVYVPLGGARCGLARQSFNLMLTMILGGLWHGAGWNFVIWGAFNGLLLTVNHIWRMWRGAADPGRLRRLLGWLSTFVAFTIGMVLFRAADPGAAGRLLSSMAGLGGFPAPQEILLEWDQWGIKHGYISEHWVREWLGATWSVRGMLWVFAALSIALLLPDTMEICNYREGEPHSVWRRARWTPSWEPSPAWLTAVVVLLLTELQMLDRVHEFLYYQF